MSMINERIYVGSMEDARNWDFIRSRKINVVVNCSKDISNFFCKEPEIAYYRVPVEDDQTGAEITSFYYFAKELVPMLAREYTNGATIFIHCRAGMQRSAALCLLLLLYLRPTCDAVTGKTVYNTRIDDIAFYMLSKRPCVFNYGIQMNFRNAIVSVINDWNMGL